MNIFGRVSRGIKKFKIVSLVIVAALVVSGISHPWAHAASTPAFVQGKANKISTGTTNNVAFVSPNTSGNLIAVYVVWGNKSAAALTDSAGNTYASAQPPAQWSTNGQWSSQVFYAKNIAGGANTVSATFGTAVNNFGLIYIHEYSGLDKVTPLDNTASAIGTAAAMNSGDVTTAAANDLIFGAGASSNSVNQAGAGFASRIYTYGNRTEDKTAPTAGTYNATASQNGTAWAMHAVAFKADSGVSDTVAPTVPANLSATASSSSQVNLTWSPSTDNVGVVAYKIYRDGVQIATSPTAAFTDNGLNAGTTYSYTVGATDAAGNNSALSTPASATTQTVPTVSLSAPAAGATVSGNAVVVSADVPDSTNVAGVQFLLDGVNLGAEDTTAPYATTWDTSTTGNGVHSLSAKIRDGATADPRTVTVANSAAPTGLAAGYTFDDGIGTTAADASGHNITGTLANDATWQSGKYGSAVGLDGVNDYVNLGNPTELQISGSLTASAWVNSSAFPSKDATIISKRGSGEKGYQLDATPDRGARTIGFKLTNSAGGQMFRYGATTLAPNTWYHVTGVYNATAGTLDVYLNGQLDNGDLVGTITSSQIMSTANAAIGRRASGGYYFNGKIDDARIYSRPLTQAEIQADMNTPLGSAGTSDATPPVVAIHEPIAGSTVHDIVNVEASADDIGGGVAGVQFYIDGQATGSEDKEAPYALAWDTRTLTNGAHTIQARARDAANNTKVSEPVAVVVANSSYFTNEVLATGMNLPVAMKFMPNGDMLVVELKGTVKVVKKGAAPYYTTVESTPFLQLPGAVSGGYQRGIFDLALDPDFATNHHYYIFYTVASDDHDRLSRFTANATLTGTDPATEVVLYNGPANTNDEHHGGGIAFDSQGKLFFTSGDGFNTPNLAQQLNSPRGKLHRINKDGTIPADNPFNDGAGSNVDSIWALGLRNPYRMFYDAPTDKMYIGDVGGNDLNNSKEELNVAARGANYGWPSTEGPCSSPCTSPLYYYGHNGRDASITGGFVYHGSQMPSAFEGSYIFGDYAQNWIRRLNFDANGAVATVSNVEPADGSLDAPYGDIVYIAQGPDGAIYYLDLGYSDVSGDSTVSKIRRISYTQTNQAPVSKVTSDVTTGPLPLTVNFSSAGSSDPESQPLSYIWDFGDGSSSTEANPAHVYAQAGQFNARLTVSDGNSSTISLPLTISAGNKPVATILSPQNGATFRAGDVISFNGDATDAEDGTVAASGFSWTVDFLHEGHVHPGAPTLGSKTGSFTVPSTGHDFSSNTRFRITLSVTDSSGLTSTQQIVINPQKVNITFTTAPAGVTLYLDGIAHATPFTYDTLIGFNHTVEARNQNTGSMNYEFTGWSDGGSQQHVITVPDTNQTLTATYTATPISVTPAMTQVVAATPQTAQTSVSATYNAAQSAGNLNAVVIGWDNITSNITSVTDIAGNTYQVAAPTTRSAANSQAIYYAKNIVGAGSASNTVTVTFDAATPYVDLRATEYVGLDTTNPVDVSASAGGAGTQVSSGAATTTAANALLFGAGTTRNHFTAPGAGYTTRIITSPNGDLVEDRLVNAIGSYSATATQSSTNKWVMQMVAFRAASQSLRR